MSKDGLLQGEVGFVHVGLDHFTARLQTLQERPLLIGELHPLPKPAPELGSLCVPHVVVWALNRTFVTGFSTDAVHHRGVLLPQLLGQGGELSTWRADAFDVGFLHFQLPGFVFETF